MQITYEMLKAMAGKDVRKANAMSVIVSLDKFGAKVGLDQPHRLAHYLAQLGHESMWFRYDGEIWGPTPAQKRYEGRRDLGNTRKGDGYRFRGRSPIQLTGRANYRSFTAWVHENIDADAPDFEREPDLINTDPWEGLVPIWYWTVGNPERRSLNKYADDNNIEMVTRRINGGLNGYQDRIDRYVIAGLVLLGYRRNDVKQLQKQAGISVDGVAGPMTRMSLHKALKGHNPHTETITEEIDKPTVPETIDQEVKKKTGLWGWLTSIFGGGGAGAAALFGMNWQTIAALAGVGLVGVVILLILGPQIVRAVRKIRMEIEGAV